MTQKQQGAAMLHVIDHFPIDAAELEKTTFGDNVVLTENAIYAAIQDNEIHKLFKQALKRFNCFVLRSAMKARGVDTDDLVSGINVIDEIDYLDIADESIAMRSWN